MSRNGPFQPAKVSLLNDKSYPFAILFDRFYKLADLQSFTRSYSLVFGFELFLLSITACLVWHLSIFPLLVPFAAFFIAYLDKGCNLMATYCGIPAQLIDIIQAVIFLFFAAEQFLSGYRQKLVVRSAQQELREKEGQK